MNKFHQTQITSLGARDFHDNRRRFRNVKYNETSTFRVETPGSVVRFTTQQEITGDNNNKIRLPAQLIKYIMVNFNRR